MDENIDEDLDNTKDEESSRTVIITLVGSSSSPLNGYDGKFSIN
jgi:hypothetical protein